MEKNKYHVPPLPTKEQMDYNISEMKDVKIVVEEKVVGEMWTIFAGNIHKVREKIAAQNPVIESNAHNKPK